MSGTDQAGAAAASRHVPVMLERCIALLAPALARPEAVVVDATLGMGGHSEAMLERFPQLTLVGIDRDPTALDLAGQRLAAHSDRIHLVHAVYDEIAAVLAGLGLPEADGVLFDLGVSSLQLDEAERGFSYQQAADLDMRMNPADPVSAAEVVNTYSQVELSKLIGQFGEERFAGRIAAAIVERRDRQPLTNTVELAELIREAIPAAARRTGGHPAKRTFQAIRIEVNRELSVLRNAVPAALAAVNLGGRVVVMSYHSLEDRIVKQAFAEVVRDDYPIDLPLPAGHTPEFRLLTKGGERPSPDEVAVNPRAASAKLRAVERMRVAA